MCGIAVMAGPGWSHEQLSAMAACQRHRGPDDRGRFVSKDGTVGIAHERLKIIDLSEAARQPMTDPEGRYWIAFNGEIYNYVELRSELASRYAFRTTSDTEVLLAAYREWGEACLDRLIGMFAFVVWDEREGRLFAARDRFGVKPLFVHEAPEGGVWLASEIKALHAAGVPREPDAVTWATYLATGMYDHAERTFWRGIRQLPRGSFLTWKGGQGIRVETWYDPAERAIRQGPDERADREVGEELEALLKESVRLRFRSDVPVGICLSGGFDSSLLFGLVGWHLGGKPVPSFTFHCGDDRYDEVPFVRMLVGSSHSTAHFCLLEASEVPELVSLVQAVQDEPFGGIPTLGMAKVHERARQEGITVLLDGNGLDEGWAGYDYYQRASEIDEGMGPVQGSRTRSTGPDSLTPEFAALAESFVPPRPFGEPLADLQYRDLCFAKIPRAMRFADRVSMLFSRELREPFLDHRILELGLRQPPERKIRGGTGKWLPRQVAARVLPAGVREAPKRPVQTPQREWLRGPLRGWAEGRIEEVIDRFGGDWLDACAVRKAWDRYREGEGDSSFFVWQWISLAMMLAERAAGRVRPSDELQRICSEFLEEGVQ
ncbi:asparagine synthase (glutamine-hydrolyzing) [soil metagenome]